MGSLDRKIYPQEEIELRSMVESLQVALFNHKQHIANEVRNILLTDLSLTITNNYQTFSDKCNQSLYTLEKSVSLELQSINFKIQSIESKSSELFTKIAGLESLILQNSNNLSENQQKCNEKMIVLEQRTMNLLENLRKVEESNLIIAEDLWKLTETVNNLKRTVENDVKSVNSENKAALDGFKFEVLHKMQKDLFEMQEKVNEIKTFTEQEAFNSSFGSNLNINSGVEYKNLVEFMKLNVNKCYLDIGSLRMRVEKLEISQQVCEEFRKNQHIDRLRF